MRAPALTDAQFTALRALLARLAGLAFEPSRRESLGYSVAERLRATGAPDVDAYLALVDEPEERQRLLDEVTIQETHFFRNPPQVRALRQHVLPALIRAAEGTRRLRVWSAGCSTGEEPYTVAMLLRELLPSTSGWDVKVLGTDVSERALAAARTARYGPRAVQMATPEDRARHFVMHPDGSAEVRPEVRELVELRHHNLVTEPVPFGPGQLDLVLCRNVTIYFARDTTRALMERLHTGLRDGGYLFLGHSETLWQVSESFRLVPLGTGDAAAFVYRRLDGPGRPGERRAVLPDRRTGDDGLPARAPVDRRYGPRRAEAQREAAARAGATPGADTDPGAPAGPPPVPSPRPRSAPRLAPVVVTATRPAPVAASSTRPAGAATRPAPASARRTGLRPVDPGPAPSLPRARAALAEGRYDDAVALASAVAASDPLSSEAHYVSGLASVSLGDDAAALVALRKAVYLDGTAGLAHFLLAGALERTGDRAAARREYRAAASTLAARDAGAPELGGRGLADLVALCLRMSEQPDEERT